MHRGGLRALCSAGLLAVVAACGNWSSGSVGVLLDPSLTATDAWRIGTQEVGDAAIRAIEVTTTITADRELRVTMRRHKVSGWVDEHVFDFRIDSGDEVIVESAASTFNASNPSDVSEVRSIRGTITVNGPLSTESGGDFVFEYKLRGSQGGSPVDLKGKIAL